MGNCYGRSSPKVTVASSSFSSKNTQVGSHNSRSTTSKTSDRNMSSSIPSFRSYSLSPVTLKSFTLNDLKNSTRNFRSDSFLGEGGFGCVYKGWIDENTFSPSKPGIGIVVAIKKLKLGSFQGHKEWLAEVKYLGQLRHDNLVKLIGYCSEGDNKLLVYEYMQRGSLENHLLRRTTHPIPWVKRIKIAIEVARGLSFLHSLENQVIFRDLKASNVLLDSDLNAKLSDFGLARSGPTGDKTHVSTRVMGTRGYAAPEYVATGHLSAKSDIYSFGVVLLELLTGRRALDENNGSEDDTLVDWARPFLNEKRKILRIMDTRLEGQYSKKEAQAIGALALQCLQNDPRCRPNMTEVLPALVEIQSPKDSSIQRVNKNQQLSGMHSKW